MVVPAGASILGLGLNLSAKSAATASLQAAARQSGSTRLVGSPLAPPAAAYTTFQSIAELNPATGLPWTEADIVGSTFGFRALTGTGEHVSQFFLEKLWLSGIGSYAY